MQQSAKKVTYYYTGAFLLYLSVMLFVALLTAESFAGQPGHTYEYLLAAFAAILFVAMSILTRRSMKRGRHAVLEANVTGVLRFVTSSVMLAYAYTKLHHGHMYASYAALDTRLNDLSDFDTVWSFYGRFSSLQALLGIFELVPAVLLLFRRTTFIGAVLLLPVISNVVLLNIYYDIGGFTLPVALLVLIFDIYILLGYKAAIRDLLARVSVTAPGLTPSRGRRILSALRFAPLVLLGALILLNLLHGRRDQLPTGAYELISFVSDGKRIPADSLPFHAFRKIYLEKRRLQSSLVNGGGAQGARFEFRGRDSILVVYRNGPLDLRVPDDTTGKFVGVYRSAPGTLALSGVQRGTRITAVYRRLPLREFSYWWQ